MPNFKRRFLEKVEKLGNGCWRWTVNRSDFQWSYVLDELAREESQKARDLDEQPRPTWEECVRRAARKIAPICRKDYRAS